MKCAELRKLTNTELFTKLNELKEEFMRIRCNSVLQTESDVKKKKKTKLDIARVYTILNEKKITSKKLTNENS